MTSPSSAEELNRSCFCITSDRARVLTAIDGATAASPDRAGLFAEVPAFVPAKAFASMLAVVEAVEATAALPAYRELALGRAPGIAQSDPGPLGVFMGYDFHIAGGAPRLIEINTNAGGASINAALLAAQRACCDEVERQILVPDGDFDRRVIEMFAQEWRRQRGTDGPGRIAIVDDAPDAQYLYPEFLMFRQLLAQGGIDAVIVDAAELSYENGKLLAGGKEIDLVYNRLVDFLFEAPGHAALRRAYEDRAVVVTPNPHLHALFADKRNMIPLSDPSFLLQAGLGLERIAALGAVPRTVAVTKQNAHALWAERRDWFFKPYAGHGGKAVYRGDKLTRGVWAEIIKGGYVAQAFAAPGQRMIRLNGEPVARKMDVRLYTYGGKLLLAAARLYQGQTTNFRTEGGGFAAVYVV